MKEILDPFENVLIKALRRGYGFQDLKKDALAALVVSLVALPLAMALAIGVGLPPQHGLYTAIVAGIVVPLLGGSAYQVSGPTAAFVVIVAPIVAQYGLRGLILSTLLAGILMMALGFLKLGRFINYMPYPVTTGFTAGIAVVIGTLSLNDFLGLNIGHFDEHYLGKVGQIVRHIPHLELGEAGVGIASLGAMLFSYRFFPRVPAPLLGIGIGTLLAYVLNGYGLDIATLGNRFTYPLPDGVVGHGIPPFPPKIYLLGLSDTALFAWPTLTELGPLLMPAMVIAVLGALESLLSATVADGLTGQRHQPNRELVGVGMGNILSALAAGMPATGAIARTATNIHAGARSPLASVLHAVFILLFVVFLAPLFSLIPMASLAALLLTVAYHMSHHRQFLRILQLAPRSDNLVLLTCFSLTVLVDMVVGVGVGIVLACLLIVRQFSHLTHGHISHATKGYHPKLKSLIFPEDTLVYHIQGPLFFGTVENTLYRTEFVQDDIKTVILDLEHVPLIDMSGLVALKVMILDLQTRGKMIVLCGAPRLTQPILEKLPPASREKIQVLVHVKNLSFPKTP